MICFLHSQCFPKHICSCACTGFCFVYMKDDKEGDRAIRKLDGKEVGYKRRPLRVQWAKVCVLAHVFYLQVQKVFFCASVCTCA